MAPNVKSLGAVARHVSLMDLSSMARSHSFQALSRAVSDADLQQLAEPEFINEPRTFGKNAFSKAPAASADYWGWDEQDEDEAIDVFDSSATPLTTPSETAPSSASYWDWPAETEAKPEPVVDVLSLANIESNLLQAANKLNGAEAEAKAVESHDDYWAEASSHVMPEPVQPEHKPQHQQLSYWDWPTTTKEQDKQALIEYIKQSDAALKLVSGDAIERSLRSAPTSQRTTSAPASEQSDDYWAWESKDAAQPPHVADALHPDYDYWTWNGDAPKPSPLDAILAYERARLLLTAEHTERTLQKKQTISSAPIVRSNVNSDAYWDESQALGDAYWDERPAAPVAAVGGYWDW